MIKAGRLLLTITLFLAASTLLAGCLTRQRYTLTIAVTGDGTVTPAGGKFAKRSVVTLTPTPSQGWAFAAWGGAHRDAVVWNDVKKAYNIFMDGDKYVTALFVPSQLNVTVTPIGSGAVLQEATSSGGAGGQPGLSVLLTALPAERWVFDHWEEDLSGTSNPETILVNREVRITAVFVPLRFPLNVTVRGQGRVDESLVAAAPTAASAWETGTTVRLHAVPANSDWVFSRWEGDLLGAVNPQAIVMNGAKSVTGIFSARIDKMAPGWIHTVAVTPGGEVYTWGGNNAGELGDGTNTAHNTPGSVSGLPPLGSDAVIAIAAGTNTGPGASHTAAVTQSGAVYAWGYNAYGQLGNGTTANSSVPVRVSGLPANVVAVAAGAYHTAVLTNTGEVWAWGDNRFGQVGNGTTTRGPADPDPEPGVLAPVRVTGLPPGDRVTAIAAGGYHTVALTESGVVYTWGHNRYGQIGDGTTTNRPTPVQVTALSGTRIDSIAPGRAHTMVLAGGAVYGWGRNDSGQVGVLPETGEQTNTFYPPYDSVWYRSAPVLVSGLPAGVTQISAGQSHTVILATAGVFTWGSNANGQLGDGTAASHSYSPVQVSGLPDDITAVASGRDHVTAITSSGVMYAWGFNHDGQLGDGSNVDRNRPVLVNW